MTDENILKFEISVNDMQLVDILDPTYYLIKHFACLIFLHFPLFNDVIEELTTLNVLHDYEQLFGSLNNFVKLDDIGMPNDIENVNFP